MEGTRRVSPVEIIPSTGDLCITDSVLIQPVCESAADDIQRSRVHAISLTLSLANSMHADSGLLSYSTAVEIGCQRHKRVRMRPRASII